MNNPESYSDNNHISLTTILRAIRFSQNQFSLLFLRCNYGKLQQEIVKELQKTSPVPIRELSVKTSTKSLQSQISEELINEQPQALMIFGLDTVENIESFLKSANQSREEFRKNFPFPVLIWIDDQMLKTIIRIAPDLENWGSVIDFEHDNDDLIDLLQQTTEEIFNHEVIVTPQVYKEITSANQDLQKRGQEIDPEIQAKLQFVLGLTEYWRNNLNLALNYYQSSLKFWQDNNNLEFQGIVLVKIALAYVKQVEITNDENLENWQNARNYLQEAITIFENIARSDLVIENSNILGGILRNLKTWTELENLAQKSIQLYIKVYENTFPVSPSLVKSLGQNYGFLAEVALENQEYQKANQNAQKAIKILANIPEIANYEYSLYRLLLARSQIGLNEISSAIKTLETAKDQSHPQYNHQYNPKIYIKILKELHSLYFQENQYLKAFEIKQERLQVKQQYGFLAFVGASYLNPQWKVINSISEVQQTGTIAQEISASGREEDVKRLRERISETENKLIVIHGQSGVGKSSILQGGLVPALQQEPIGEKDALPILLRVYTNWIELLEKSLISNVETFHGTSPQSTDKIIEQLRKNANRNILTVLIFDQFEEFFFVYPDREKRQSFYDFLKISLDIPFIKIVLSLREDYLHYLLEIDRLCNLTVTSNNILDKKIRYYLGNFTSADAKSVIESLTTRSKFYLQPELIDELVKDLAGNIEEIRPIELQIVGSQLQTEKITTLEKYQEFGKEKLVEKFLEDVIKDCGAENEKFARLVLYLLTDENGTRPLKTRAELSEQLAEINKNLDLVLNIFIGSGLVLLLPESPENRYQLVHDYLVEFIRKQQGNELLEKLAKAEAELKQEQEARQILANAKIQADTQIAKAEKRLKLSSTLALGLVIIAGLASVYGINQVREANIAKTKQQESEQKNQELQSQTQYLTLQSEQAEKTKQAAEKKFKLAQQNIKKAQENLLTAIARVEEVNKQADILKQQNTAATEKIKTANDNVKAAADKLQAAQRQQQEAENKAKKAEQTFIKANAELKTAETAKKEALLVTKLEQGGVNVLRQFQFEELPSLVSAVRNGKALKTLVKNKTLDKYPTISPIYALNNILDNISDRNIFKGHQNSVMSVSFSPDGKTIATGSWDKTARLWNLQGQLIQEFKGHQGAVYSVSFSPDGKTIATASDDKTARLWNLQGQLIQEFKGHQDYVKSVSFSPDGKTIATASLDKTARLWNLQGQLIQEFKGHQDYVMAVSFSPDGKTIATASSDNTARLWNLKGELLQEFKEHQNPLSVSVNGKTIPTGMGVSFSPDGKTIATGSWDKTARLWNLQGQLIQEFTGHQGSVMSVSFSPDGKTIATASDDKTARLWNLQGQMIQEFKGHQDYVKSVSFSPDGKTIATGSWDKTARLWNLQGQLIQEFKGHQDYVKSVSFSPDGKTIATASDDKTARLWNLQGQLIQEFKGHQGAVYSVSFSPDGKTIATASSDKTARLWNLQGQMIQEFKGHQGSVMSVSFSPDGKTIATASDDKTARLWNLQGQMIQEFKGHQGAVYSVSFSPDGKTIATASSDKTARLWNLQGQMIQEFKGHQGAVHSVSFSPDGKTIATAFDKTARLWNLQGQMIQELKGHQESVWSVSFSPDGKTIATASDDKTARLWNLQGQLIQEFKGHQDWVWSVSFSPDGKTIATASSDKTARLWPVRDLDRVIKDGCEYLKYYLHNPQINLSGEDRRLCDGV